MLPFMTLSPAGIGGLIRESSFCIKSYAMNILSEELFRIREGMRIALTNDVMNCYIFSDNIEAIKLLREPSSGVDLVIGWIGAGH